MSVCTMGRSVLFVSGLEADFVLLVRARIEAASGALRSTPVDRTIPARWVVTREIVTSCPDHRPPERLPLYGAS
jgi:hypothetical protein